MKRRDCKGSAATANLCCRLPGQPGRWFSRRVFPSRRRGSACNRRRDHACDGSLRSIAGSHPRVSPRLMQPRARTSCSRRCWQSSSRVAIVARASPPCQASASSISVRACVGRVLTSIASCLISRPAGSVLLGIVIERRRAFGTSLHPLLPGQPGQPTEANESRQPLWPIEPWKAWRVLAA